jgi:hypothetical protein
MRLPFSQAEFLAVFAVYNAAWWPVALLLWLITLASIVLLYRRWSGASTLFSGLLALQWAWSGVRRHVAPARRPLRPGRSRRAVCLLAPVRIPRPGPVLQDKLALGFILDALLALIVLGAFLATRPIGRVGWQWFVFLSLLGGLGFSRPLYDWPNRNRPE